MNDSEKLISCLTSLYGMDIREAVPTLVECISEVAEVDWAVSWDIDPYNSYYRFGNTRVSCDILRSIIIHTDVASLEGLVTQIILNRPSPEPAPEYRIGIRNYSAFSDWIEAEMSSDAYRILAGAMEPEVTAESRDNNGFTPKLRGIRKRSKEDNGRLKEGDNKMIDDFLNEYQAK